LPETPTNKRIQPCRSSSFAPQVDPTRRRSLVRTQYRPSIEGTAERKAFDAQPLALSRLDAGSLGPLSGTMAPEPGDVARNQRYDGSFQLKEEK
jgi:hypothetical protein